MDIEYFPEGRRGHKSRIGSLGKKEQASDEKHSPSGHYGAGIKGSPMGNHGAERAKPYTPVGKAGEI